MKQIRIFTILALSLMLFSCNGNAQNERKAKNTSQNKIEVIDFHSTHRCMTCNAIEANTKYTLDNYFANELKSGKITFQSVNVDKDENYEMAEKYEASGTSLFLNVVINGKETIINLTDFAFSKGRDKEAFSKSLKTKLEEQLKKL
ncbi:MAG: hypothetical protein B6I20_10570 [Bacteroidetes bacterium 4572_117]|nr:MAG: hypothetical protein B6I20_10570 [Bacteroidetes bacterium 4572_117]